MSSNRRRLPVSHRRIQGTLVTRLTIHWALFVAIAAVFTVVMSVFSDPFRPVSAHLADAGRTYGVLLTLLVALVPVFIWDTVKFSHRFVGPMVRFRRVVRDLADGEIPPDIKLRDKDFWTDHADEMNALMARLRSVEAGGDSAVAAEAWRLAEEVAEVTRQAPAEEAETPADASA